jgi:hypothetical protein
MNGLEARAADVHQKRTRWKSEILWWTEMAVGAAILLLAEIQTEEHAGTRISLGAGLLFAQNTASPPEACRGTSAPGSQEVLPVPSGRLEPIRLSPDGRDFVLGQTGKRFYVWGLNYDHDTSGRLLEDYWQTEWERVEEDFRQMKQLGANLVRIHLQVGRFLDAPDRPNRSSLNQLARLVRLAEMTGLYLDITGLGCYHQKEVPRWYDELPEARRWEAQAVFWEAVAHTCAKSPAVFCYDLMNEPVLPAPGKKETQWLLGELGGKHFVQRISLDLAGRTPEQVAKAWVDRLTAAIRKQDREHLITISEIPWTTVFPGAKSIFHSREVGAPLDFLSVHFYPEKGGVPKALKALAVYDVGKPLLVEEIFPLRCSLEELDAFVEGSRQVADGWIGFFWGKMPAEYAHQKDNPFQAALMKAWLEYFQAKSAKICPP